MGQGAHDRQQGRTENLLLAQRVSRRIKGSSGEEAARQQVGLDDSRGGSRHAAEEQAACAACEEAAHLSRCGGNGAAPGGEDTSGLNVNLFFGRLFLGVVVWFFVKDFLNVAGSVLF